MERPLDLPAHLTDLLIRVPACTDAFATLKEFLHEAVVPALERRRAVERELSRLQRRLREVDAEAERARNPQAPARPPARASKELIYVLDPSLAVSDGVTKAMRELSERLQQAQSDLREIRLERDELKSRGVTGESQMEAEIRRLREENRAIQVERERFEKHFNLEVKKLQSFKDEMLRFRQDERDKMVEQITDLHNEREDMLFQEIDDEKCKNKLQSRLDCSLDELRTLAEVTEEQEHEIERLMMVNELLEQQLAESRKAENGQAENGQV